MLVMEHPCYYLPMAYVQDRPGQRIVQPARWIEPEPLPPAMPLLHDDPLLSELLYRRNIRNRQEARDFLNSAPRPAPNPWLLPNLHEAVSRIQRAITGGERIAIYGDYDADGITATALLARALGAALPSPNALLLRLPTRSEGYGLNANAIQEFAAAGASLLIAVDCGSTDERHVQLARAAGLDVIVLDHHHIGDRAPDGAIVVSAYLEPGGPYRELSAVGVAYLLVSALAQEGIAIDGRDGEPETALLDLVALGTIGDIAPLTGVNRALVRDGLRRIRSKPRPGLVALCRAAGLDVARVTSEQISYKLVPRLNAAGRVGDPHRALDLLLTEDPSVAARIVGEIEAFNNERRLRAQTVVDEAIALITARPDWEECRVLMAWTPAWPSGVLGLAANRLVETFGRPVLLLTVEGEVARGSARSVPGVSIVEALEQCSALLSGWGGHSQAAGMSLPATALPALWEALEDHVTRLALDFPVEPQIRLDADLPLERLTLETAQRIEWLQPFGPGNEPPVLRLRGVPVRAWQRVGEAQDHLQIVLASKRGTERAIFFGAGERASELQRDGIFDFAVTLALDHWNGSNRLSVVVKDFRKSEQELAGGG